MDQVWGSWGGIAPYGMVFGRQTVIYPSGGEPPRLGPRWVPELGFIPPDPVQLAGERFVRPVARAIPPRTPAHRIAGQDPASSRVLTPRHPESAFPCFGYPPITMVREAMSQNAVLPAAVQTGQNTMATEWNSPVLPRRASEHQTSAFPGAEPTRPQQFYHFERINVSRGLLKRAG